MANGNCFLDSFLVEDFDDLLRERTVLILPPVRRLVGLTIPEDIRCNDTIAFLLESGCDQTPVSGVLREPMDEENSKLVALGGDGVVVILVATGGDDVFVVGGVHDW